MGPEVSDQPKQCFHISVVKSDKQRITINSHQTTSHPVRTALAVLEADTLAVVLADSSSSESLELLDDNDSLRYLLITGFTGDLL